MLNPLGVSPNSMLPDDWLDTDAEVRKCGEQTGLDTLVVHTVNDECQTSASMLVGVTPNGLSIPPGEYGRKIKTQRN